MKTKLSAIVEDLSIKKLIESGDSNVKEVENLLAEMRSEINPSLAKFAVSFVGWILNRIYKNFEVKVPDGLDLKDLAKKHNVVLVPNHQSHADYVIFNYLLHKKFGVAPYTAGGINLNFFLMGSFFRNLGCIFIRRSFQDNKAYKATLKAYITDIMKAGGHPIEFYFEGGRSRNGMLMTPKFGLFSMIIDGYRNSKNSEKSLLFIPASIIHDHLPEQGALAKEVAGGTKTPESFLQFLKIAKLLNEDLGSIYLNLGKPISYKETTGDLRATTQEIAFSIYREVAAGIPVSPMALISIALLDAPMGRTTWNMITIRAADILNYCKFIGIPLVDALSDSSWEESLRSYVNRLVKDGSIKAEKMEHLGDVYYSIVDNKRVELVYFKNTILHHFLVPYLIHTGLVKIRSKSITTVEELTQLIQEKRKELKYEFYLPATSKMWKQALKVLDYFLAKNITAIDQLFSMTESEMDSLGERVGIYANLFRYKYEAYYIGNLTLIGLGHKTFSQDEYFKRSYETFILGQQSGQIIKHPESFSLPVIKNTLDYALNQGLVVADGKKLKVSDSERLKTLVYQYSQDLLEIYQTNLKGSLRGY